MADNLADNLADNMTDNGLKFLAVGEGADQRAIARATTSPPNASSAPIT